MEVKKFIDRRVILTVLALGAGGAALTGCADYSGEGNKFVVGGQVTNAGEQSLQAEIYDIVSTHGRADGWFELGEKHRIHDNCNCHGAWNGNKQYGEVRDFDGNVIEPSAVPLGACVEFDGKIKSNQEGKTWDDRPVFEIAQEIHCPVDVEQ